MSVCQICRHEFQRVAAFCPNCGAPLSALAARLREARRRSAAPQPAEPIVLPDLEDVESEV